MIFHLTQSIKRETPLHSAKKLIKGPWLVYCLYTNKYQNVYVLLTADAVHKQCQWWANQTVVVVCYPESAVRSPKQSVIRSRNMARICYMLPYFSQPPIRREYRVFMKSNIR